MGKRVRVYPKVYLDWRDFMKMSRVEWSGVEWDGNGIRKAANRFERTQQRQCDGEEYFYYCPHLERAQYVPTSPNWGVDCQTAEAVGRQMTAIQKNQ